MYAAKVPRLPLVEDSDDPFLLGDCFEFSPRFGCNKRVDPLAPLVVLHDVGRCRRVCYFPELRNDLRSEVDKVGADVVKVSDDRRARMIPRGL